MVDHASTVKPEMDAFLARLRQRHPADRAVLVVGHSNTIPELLRRLGAAPDCFARLGIKATGNGLEIEGYDGLWKVELAKPGCAGMTRQASSPQATPGTTSRSLLPHASRNSKAFFTNASWYWKMPPCPASS